MRRGLLLALALLVVGLGCTTELALAQNNEQNREKFVISARAGGINAITGRATVQTSRNAEWQPLTIHDDLQGGDIVRTGSDSRVEMLLNPGSYLRVGENSEFVLASNSLENLEIRIIRGAAIVEATGADGMELLINITTPHAKLAIVRHGLYRVNVLPTDSTELIVRKGRVVLSDSQKNIKGGNKVVFSGNSTYFVAKLQKHEKKHTEALDVWSKDRASTLAKANRRITDRMLTSALTSFNSSFAGFFDNRARSGGLWVFNARTGCYTFLPFYFGWGSPYGSSYSNTLYYSGFGCCGNRRGLYQSYPNMGGNPSAGSGGSNPRNTITSPSPSMAPPKVDMSPPTQSPSGGRGKSRGTLPML